MLTLVRHAMPEITADVSPHDWSLSADGQAAAAALAAVIPRDAVLVASAERKAQQTLEPSGDVVIDARFNEVARDEPFDTDFRARRRRYLAGEFVPRWESRMEVADRFAAAADEWLGFADGRPLVIGTHGMALTLWLQAAIGLADPVAFWSDLWLPDVLRVDLDAATVTKLAVRA